MFVGWLLLILFVGCCCFSVDVGLLVFVIIIGVFFYIVCVFFWVFYVVWVNVVFGFGLCVCWGVVYMIIWGNFYLVFVLFFCGFFFLEKYFFYFWYLFVCGEYGDGEFGYWFNLKIMLVWKGVRCFFYVLICCYFGDCRGLCDLMKSFEFGVFELLFGLVRVFFWIFVKSWSSLKKIIEFV